MKSIASFSKYKESGCLFSVSTNFLVSIIIFIEGKRNLWELLFKIRLPSSKLFKQIRYYVYNIKQAEGLVKLAYNEY
jgi:hypothetical protein